MIADDTILYFSDKSTANIEKRLNEEAEIVERWVNDNCLLLNQKKGKTEFILYCSRPSKQPKCLIKINNIELNQSDSYKYLGVSLGRHLNSNSHYKRTREYAHISLYSVEFGTQYH